MVRLASEGGSLIGQREPKIVQSTDQSEDRTAGEVQLVCELLVRSPLGAGEKIYSLEYFDDVTPVHRERIRHSRPPHNEDFESWEGIAD